MGKLNKQKIDRFNLYKYRNWITPAFIIAIVALVYWALAVRPPTSYGVCLQGFNHTERGISNYSVNGEWGGNIAQKETGDSYGGGGGLACGGTIEVGAVTVKWQFPLQTREQLDQGINVLPETHEVIVPMPVPESRNSRYFQVHFYPDNHVELFLSDLP